MQIDHNGVDNLTAESHAASEPDSPERLTDILRSIVAAAVSPEIDGPPIPGSHSVCRLCSRTGSRWYGITLQHNSDCPIGAAVVVLAEIDNMRRAAEQRKKATMAFVLRGTGCATEEEWREKHPICPDCSGMGILRGGAVCPRCGGEMWLGLGGDNKTCPST